MRVMVRLLVVARSRDVRERHLDTETTARHARVATNADNCGTVKVFNTQQHDWWFDLLVAHIDGFAVCTMLERLIRVQDCGMMLLTTGDDSRNLNDLGIRAQHRRT